MTNKLLKKLLKILVLSVLFIASFIQACKKPTPAANITDANETPIADGTAYISIDPVLGSSYLSISVINTTGITIEFIEATTTPPAGGGTGTTTVARETLTNVSGVFGSYHFQNGSIAASVKFADENSIRATITSLLEPYFILENVLCQK